MLQIFTEDSAIYQQTENAKTNNNIVGHYLVNHCEICIDVYVYRSPPPQKKRTFILPPKYHTSVLHILS